MREDDAARSLFGVFANKAVFQLGHRNRQAEADRDPHFFEELVQERLFRPLVILDEIHKYKDWRIYLKASTPLPRRFLFLVSGKRETRPLPQGRGFARGRYYLMHLLAPDPGGASPMPESASMIFACNPIQPHADQTEPPIDVGPARTQQRISGAVPVRQRIQLSPAGRRLPPSDHPRGYP